MLSEKSKKTVTACRFCCMCRHLCPLGLALGKELNNPRAKALILSMVEKGVVQESEVSQDIYECCLCNACANNCETGYEPAIFIREMRSQLVAAGLAPAYVMDVIDSLLKDGTLYGVAAEQTLRGFNLPQGKGAEVLVYIGQTAAVKEEATAKAVLSLLTKAGIEYNVMLENLSSGASEYDLIGEVRETKDVVAACAKAINAYGAKRLVVLDTSDARMMKQEYPAWGVELGCEVWTATAFIDKIMTEGKLNVQKAQGTVTFHDPERLARDIHETEPARRLIAAMGYTLKEMWQSKELTKACGGEVMGAYAPDHAQKTAQGVMDNAVGTGADMLICACPGCEATMKRAQGIAVNDVFVLLDSQTK